MFGRRIRNDGQFADAYNNSGVIYYKARNMAAVKQYRKQLKSMTISVDFTAIWARVPISPNVPSNLRCPAYQHALELDPVVRA